MFDSRAKRIPILPETVTSEFVKDYLNNLNTIPVGVEKESLETATINLNKNYMYLITGEDISTSETFLTGIAKNILSIDNSNCIIMDSSSIFSNIPSIERLTYDNDQCTNSIEALKTIYNNKIDNKDDSTTICIITGIKSLLEKLMDEDKTKLTTMLEEAVKLKNIKFIIVDRIDDIKQLNYEDWFKQSIDLAEGIWIGNGISNQFTLKVTTASRILREEVQEGFGYIIVKGKAYLMKLMSDE